MKYVLELLAFLTLEIIPKDVFFLSVRAGGLHKKLFPWIESVLLDCWTEMSGSAQTQSNLIVQLLDICCATAKAVDEGEMDVEILACDNVRQLCIVCPRYRMQPPIVSRLFWAQLYISWVPVSEVFCAQLFVNSVEIWVMVSTRRKEQLWVRAQNLSPLLNTLSSSKSRAPEVALCCLHGPSLVSAFQAFRTLGPLSCLPPSANHLQYSPH